MASPVGYEQLLCALEESLQDQPGKTSLMNCRLESLKSLGMDHSGCRGKKKSSQGISSMLGSAHRCYCCCCLLFLLGSCSWKCSGGLFVLCLCFVTGLSLVVFVILFGQGTTTPKFSKSANLCHSPAPWKNALYSIFCAQKHELVQQTSRIVEKKAQTPIIEPQKRLDSLLLECTRCSAQTAKIQYEYDKNFSRLRDDFFAESKYCDEAYQQLTNELVQMLRDHSLFRPISQTDYNSELARLEDKFTKMRTQLKLTTCQTALTMRSRLMETKRRRRNFPKDTTRILNEHFYANYEHQYPSEEMKTHLAERCGMTVAQVSNWFGNKRIRHNKMKNTPKGQKEYEMYTGRRLPTSTSKGGARNGGVQAVSVDYPEPPSL